MEQTIALITGANKGIGFETARQLGAAGATVLVGSRDEERGRRAEATLRADNLDARLVLLDVTDEESVQAAAKWVESEFGRLDVLVNNAGIVRTGDAGQDGAWRHLPSATDLAMLRQIFETNVFGMVAVTNAMLPLLREAPAARIVNVSSSVGSLTWMSRLDGPMADLVSVSYPASKSAVNMVTLMYAKELRGTPIKVNAANPGYCATDLNLHAGFLTAAQGAEVVLHLATLPADGPNGRLWGDQWPFANAGTADRAGAETGGRALGELPW